MAYKFDCECSSCIEARSWERDNIPATWLPRDRQYMHGHIQPNYPVPAVQHGMHLGKPGRFDRGRYTIWFLSLTPAQRDQANQYHALADTRGM